LEAQTTKALTALLPVRAEREALISLTRQAHASRLWLLAWELVDALPYFFTDEPHREGWRECLDLALHPAREVHDRAGEAQILFQLLAAGPSVSVP
jgi:hypothetical protein